MSHYSYMESQRIAEHDTPFDSFIMAAMRKADTDNFAKLTAAFPEIRAELQARYDAPGGLIGGEHEEHEEEPRDA